MLSRIFPFIEWFRDYSIKTFRIDLVSGLTVALVLIPQSMAYAQLAGLPPYYGLYASLLPPTVAALFGSSRQLATGPVAVVSLMTSASLEPLATAGGEAYLAYAVLLALIVGGFQLCLGLLKLGLVVNFLSHPVVNGFTNGAALIIATSQLSKLFGVHVDKAEHHYGTIVRVIQAAAHHTHWPTLIMGLAAFALMFGLRRLNPRIPYVLVAVALAIVVSWGTGFRHDQQVSVAQVASPRFQELLTRYNTATARTKTDSARRSQISSKMAEIKGSESTARLDLEHEAALTAYDLALAQHEAEALRHELRSMLFAGVAVDGATTLVPIEEIGARPTDGRTWQLRVGNGPLDGQSLVMKSGGDVVGTVPRGMPAIGAPGIDLGIMVRLLPAAIIISLLGFMEAISIAKAMAAKTGQRLDPNQELVGQGLGNVVGAFALSYPVSGSFSRSAVNLQAGAVTGLSSVITSVTVLIVLLFFTPALYHLPQAVLAAVIMMAVFGLLNVSGFIHAWKAQWYDGLISILTFVATLYFAPHLDKGIMLGVGLSILVFLYKSMRPTVASLTVHEQSFCDAAHGGLPACPHLALIRFDGPLFFANASFLEDQVMNRIEQMPELREICIVASGINDMDASGEEALSLLVDRVRSAGLHIAFAGIKEPVMAVLRRTYLFEKIGAEHIYGEVATAVAALHHLAHDDETSPSCPLTHQVTTIPPTMREELQPCR